MSGSYAQKLDDIKSHPAWATIQHRTGAVAADEYVFTSSVLGTVATCGWRAKLLYGLDGQPPTEEEKENLQGLRGSVIHSAANRLHKTKKWDDAPDIYEEEWASTLTEDVVSFLPEKVWTRDKSDASLYEKTKSDGLTMLSAYVDRNRMADVIATEPRFFMLTNAPGSKSFARFTGSVDQLRMEGDPNPHPMIQVAGARQLAIWDLKSQAAAPDAAFIHRNKQLGSYGLGLRSGFFDIDGELVNFGQTPERFVWYHLHHLIPYKRKTGNKLAGELRGNPIYETRRTEEDYEMLRREIAKIIQLVRMKIFFRSESNFNCSMCKVTSACLTGVRYKREYTDDFAEMAATGGEQ